MLGKFWEGLAAQIGKEWAARVLTPSFVFWALGVIAWGWSRWGSGAPVELGKLLEARSPYEVSLLIAAGLGLLIASGWLADHLTFPVLRLLEGYWPTGTGWARRRLVERHIRAREQADERWQQLARAYDVGLSALERDEFIALESRLRHYPEPADMMPTRLGNVLRAAERRPGAKYGLDAVICWPRLWLTLPDGDRQEVTQVRATLDSGVRIWIWSALSLGWAVWAWWIAPVALLSGWLAYRSMLAAAEVYGELIEAVFDLRLDLLYRCLRWPLPTTASEAQKSGQLLTSYLLRGPTGQEPLLVAEP
jgi:hypothetical protein